MAALEQDPLSYHSFPIVPEAAAPTLATEKEISFQEACCIVYEVANNLFMHQADSFDLTIHKQFSDLFLKGIKKIENADGTFKGLTVDLAKKVQILKNLVLPSPAGEYSNLEQWNQQARILMQDIKNACPDAASSCSIQ
jgi:hypothetical protein